MDFEKIKNLNVLKKSESILNGLVIEEEINTTDLLKLLNSNLLKTTFNNPTSRKIYENEKHQLNCYFKLVKNGIAYVKYEKVKNMPFGRCNPCKALGLFSIRREIRQTLAKKKYVDIDIVNAHPVFLYNICLANGWKCDYLENYIKNIKISK